MRPIAHIALDWAVRSFGVDHVYNRPLRALRLAEEAVELTQAYGVPKETLHNLVEVVYNRPTGSPHQELGGVMLTASVLATVENFDLDEVFERELRRVLNKPHEHFAERNQEKIALGLDVPKKA